MKPIIVEYEQLNPKRPVKEPKVHFNGAAYTTTFYLPEDVTMVLGGYCILATGLKFSLTDIHGIVSPAYVSSGLVLNSELGCYLRHGTCLNLTMLDLENDWRNNMFNNNIVRPDTVCERNSPLLVLTTDYPIEFKLKGDCYGEIGRQVHQRQKA